jgi:thiol-disulfide isomerase/thioredoxin
MAGLEAQKRHVRWWVSILVVLSVAGVLYQGIHETILMKPMNAGEMANDFRMRRMTGGPEIVLSQLRGKVVMLDFWATWCHPCVEELPILTRLAKEYESRGLVFVAANRDDPATANQAVQSFAKQSVPDLPPYVAFASDLTSDRYALRVLPTLYLIGPRGEILQSHLGLATEAQLRNWIEKALASRDALGVR